MAYKPKTEPHGLGIDLGCINTPVAGAGIFQGAVNELVMLVRGWHQANKRGGRFWRAKPRIERCALVIRWIHVCPHVHLLEWSVVPQRAFATSQNPVKDRERVEEPVNSDN